MGDTDDLTENEKSLYSEEAIKPTPIEDEVPKNVPEVIEAPPEDTSDEEEPPALGFENEGGIL